MSPACRFLHQRAAASMQRSFRRKCCTVPLPSDGPCTSRCLQVKATPIPGKRADHQGIRVQLIGQIELAAERGHPHDFVSLGGQTLGFRTPPHQPAAAAAYTCDISGPVYALSIWVLQASQALCTNQLRRLDTSGCSPASLHMSAGCYMRSSRGRTWRRGSQQSAHTAGWKHLPAKRAAKSLNMWCCVQRGTCRRRGS
jgi:Vacuolar protein sorting-associated protein 26